MYNPLMEFFLQHCTFPIFRLLSLPQRGRARGVLVLQGLGVEWYIKWFLGVHFAANLVSVS